MADGLRGDDDGAGRNRGEGEGGFQNSSTSGMQPASETLRNSGKTYNTREMLYTAATLAQRRQQQEEETGKPAGADMAWIGAGRLVTALYEKESRTKDSATFEREQIGWELLAEEFERERFKCSLRSMRYGAHSLTLVVSSRSARFALPVIFFGKRVIGPQRKMY